MSRQRLAGVVAAISLLAVGCRSSNPATPAAGEPASKTAPAVGQVSKDSEPPFTLTAVVPRSPAGAPTALVFEVRAGEGWKINAEYPNRATLIDTQNLQAGPAAPTFEVTPKVLTGRLPVRVDGPGPSGAKAALAFALCDPTRCLPLKRELRWRFESR